MNRSLPDSDIIDQYFQSRFSPNRFFYTINGRAAIGLALHQLNLNREDVVAILTTSGNSYISHCVTDEIEKFCGWSRKIDKNTRVILVNHEFGFPFEEIADMRKYNLPIIEDCAHSFFSTDQQGLIGKVGDFVIYSFPKIFPVQTGGLLVSKNSISATAEYICDDNIIRLMKNVLSYHIQMKDEIIEKRINNHRYLEKILQPFGVDTRFELKPGIVPGVFLFRSAMSENDLQKLKLHFYSHGVQCSVFYGEESFFLPVHQALDEQDFLYFLEVMKSFIKQANS
ncbi:MAG: DegT/DnrJ/EryC1/StrS family aminotransferase [Bacteroidetes bacterium]|nr:DegT/DnrJ/EryC1/StrS family aminotransferase [Bacteroidota bacterium]